MYKKLETDLEEWNSHNIGWIGRINSIKMTLLPRILYLFRSLPIPIKTNHLKAFQSKITKFVWKKKNPRVSSRSLFNLPEQGGFGLPNLLWYYKAARLAQLSDVYVRGDRPDWVCLEEQATPSYTLEDLLWVTPKSRPPIMSPALSQAMVLWDSLKKDPSLITKGHPLANLFREPDFISKLEGESFKWWLDKGVYRIGRFFSHSGPHTEQYFVKNLGLPHSETTGFSHIYKYATKLWLDEAVRAL